MTGSVYAFFMKWIDSCGIWCCSWSCCCSWWSGNDREPNICNKRTNELTHELTHEEIMNNIRSAGII